MSDVTSNPRILMVEDDLTLADLYQMRMEAEGFEVKQCNDGEEALQAAKEFHPQLIVMDLMMPRLNGFDTIDILRHTPEFATTKIVVLSAMSQPEDIQKAKSLGADEYLVKSQMVISDVMARLREMLGLPPRTTETSDT
ncbi:MAG TPA: response regulator [Candidatus Saccharimonadia bacterium]